MKKGVICVLICMLMIGCTIIPISATTVSEKSFQPLAMESILYVGGSGPGNYTKIQDAITASSNGDAIFVYNGTYYENIEFNKVIILIGQNRNGTIIDGGGADRGMLIDTSKIVLDTNAHVTIKNIVFQNGSPPSDGGGALLIVTNYSNITIENCQFIGSFAAGSGGGLYASSETGRIKITENLFSQNTSDYQAGGAYVDSFSIAGAISEKWRL